MNICGKKHKISTYIAIITAMIAGGIFLIVMTDSLPLSASSGQSGIRNILEGKGTSADPWRIETVEDLNIVAQAAAAGESFKGEYLELRDNLQLPSGWNGIGALKEGTSGTGNGKNILPFSGNFNGNGYSITAADGGTALFNYVREARIYNLFIAGHNIKGSGLIRYYVVDHGPTGTTSPMTAVIENVTILSGTSIQGSGFLGGLSAAENTVDIRHCRVEENVIIGCNRNKEKIGSFAGDFNGTISDSRSAATVFGTSFVGGIIGCKGNSMSNTQIRNCVFTGTVVASEKYAGGIAGGGYGGTGWGISSAPNAKGLNITNCLCSGSVEAADTAGGIIGYETPLQLWDNGIGHIQNNLFAGTVRVTSGNCIGSIVGAFRGLDRYNIVTDNVYLEGCGADRGVGGSQYVDTSCESHETILGQYYYDTSKEIPSIEGVNDVYVNNIRANHNRTDDPLGSDGETLARKASSELLQDGTAAGWLNTGESSSGKWMQSEEGPVIDIDEEVIGIRAEDSCQTDYQIGDGLDLNALAFSLIWTDGHRETVQGSDDRLAITGFDSSKKGNIPLSVSWGAASVTLPVRILEPDLGEKNNVSFTLMGDDKHGAQESGILHTYRTGGLKTWFTGTYQTSPNTTARDLIIEALNDAGLTWKDSDIHLHPEYCLGGIQIPGTQEMLCQLDNGDYSCWRYLINEGETGKKAESYYLMDGDTLILHYTDDIRLESEDSQDDPDPSEEEKSSGKDSSKPRVVKGKTYVISGNYYKVTKIATAKSQGTVTLIKAKNQKKITVPGIVKLADQRKYKVTVLGSKAFRAKKIRKIIIGANVKKLTKNAFAGSRAGLLVLKTKKLTGTRVKGSLRKSKVKVIKVTVGPKKTNRSYIKKYGKIFTKRITGQKVTVK